MKLKYFVCCLLLFSMYSCQKVEEDTEDESEKEEELVDNRPTISFTFDDGITNDLLNYSFEDWNARILKALTGADLQATFFVTGANKQDEKGRYLLQSWNDAGHQIANHTFSHPNFGHDTMTAADFERELLNAHNIIKDYSNFTPLFRFPYLKAGKTPMQVDGYRDVLKQHNYTNGYVTIDASDWYINTMLIRRLRREGTAAPIDDFRDFYIQHLLERATYYDSLACNLTKRRVAHTLLLHHNLTSALFLGDLIEAFKENGWNVVDSPIAFQDAIYQEQPAIAPAGESIVWALAKENGGYEDRLRYPAEDSRYESPKMVELGLIEQ